MTTTGKHLDHRHTVEKELIGFFLLYVIVLIIIPYYLNKYMSFAIFITYFANVDIIANILAINYPAYFHHFYDPMYQRTIGQYFSFNIISIIALSGIFLFGLRDDRKPKEERFIIMLIMAFVTYTLPTQGIPYINEKVEKYLNLEGKMSSEDRGKKVSITAIISIAFILLEYILVNMFLKIGEKSKLWTNIVMLITLIIGFIGLHIIYHDSHRYSFN